MRNFATLIITTGMFFNLACQSGAGVVGANTDTNAAEDSTFTAEEVMVLAERTPAEEVMELAPRTPVDEMEAAPMKPAEVFQLAPREKVEFEQAELAQTQFAQRETNEFAQQAEFTKTYKEIPQTATATATLNKQYESHADYEISMERKPFHEAEATIDDD